MNFNCCTKLCLFGPKLDSFNSHNSIFLNSFSTSPPRNPIAPDIKFEVTIRPNIGKNGKKLLITHRLKNLFTIFIT